MPSLVNGMYEFGEFCLHPRKRVLRRGREPVSLTPKAFETLLILVERDGEVVTKDELMRAVWPDSFVEESNLTQTIFMLRKALGETSGQRYLLTIPGRGYRFVADVRRVPKNGHVESEAPTTIAPASNLGRKTARPARPRWPFPVGVAVVLIAIAGAYVQWLRPHAHARPDSNTRLMLAVLPFENFTGDAAQDYFSDGMTEELITELGRLNPEHLGVIARTSVMLYKRSAKSVDQVGRELRVQYVVEGSVRRDADRVRITAQLIQVKDQTHLWARQYDRELKDTLLLQSEIARGISDEIQSALGSYRPKLPVAGQPLSPQQYEAHDLYLRGRYFWNKRTLEGFQQAATYFQQAIAKDPNYAPAYAGLADTYGLMSTWYAGPQIELMPKARAAALKALEIDPTLPEAHTSLALIAEAYDYDWQRAEKEFRRAIGLNPDYATAHQWYGEFLAWQGRFEEALAESERARQLDPLSLIIANDQASIYYLARQYDRAIAVARAVLDMDPSYPQPQAVIFSVYMQQGRFAEALEILEHQPAGPWTWGRKAFVYSRSGRSSEVQQALEKFEQLAPKLGYWETWARAQVFVYTGQKDKALTLLERAIAEHSFNPGGIKVDPVYDPLRSDPRFQDLLRSVGLA